MAEDKNSSSFKVVDRRRFDSDGNEIDGGQKVSTSDKDSSKQGSGSSPDTSRYSDLGTPDADVTFSSFVLSLGTQGLMQLGDIEPPPGVPVTTDIEGAKQTIDILSVMKDKTKGNLTPAEDKLLEEVLHSLRLSFVRHR